MRTFTRSSIAAAKLLAVFALVGCAKSDSTGRTALGSTARDADAAARATESKLPLAAIAALDSGNAAYRAKDFERAKAHYREAAAQAPEHAAPWFGLYMVATEMKDPALADSAMARAKALSANPAAFDAHGQGDSLASAPKLPPGHPTPAPQLPPGHPPTGGVAAPIPGTIPPKKGA